MEKKQSQREKRVADGFFSQNGWILQNQNPTADGRFFIKKINQFLGFSYSFPAFAKRWL